jgi:hypothetical protein
MTKRTLVVLAVAGAFLVSVGYADIPRPGQIEQTEKAPSPGNWVFGTQEGDCFFDDFENYSLGLICGQAGPPGGWEEWDGSVDVCGDVSAEQANSGTQSLKIVGSTGSAGDDTVQQHQIVGGVWTYSVMTYVPSDATGAAYFLLLAGYPPSEAFNWTTQIRIDADMGIVESEWGTSFNIPLITDQWVELRVEIDMPNDTSDYYYDNVLFDAGQSWTNRVGSLNGKTFRATDLYANEPPTGITGIYWDDIALTSEGAPGCDPICDPCDMNCDGAINAFDIEPFLDLLFGPGPPCNTCTGDVNGDGVIDAFDIEPFLECLFP